MDAWCGNLKSNTCRWSSRCTALVGQSQFRGAAGKKECSPHTCCPKTEITVAEETSKTGFRQRTNLNFNQQTETGEIQTYTEVSFILQSLEINFKLILFHAIAYWLGIWHRNALPAGGGGLGSDNKFVSQGQFNYWIWIRIRTEHRIPFWIVVPLAGWLIALWLEMASCQCFRLPSL